MEHQWNEIYRGKPTTRRKTCPSVTLSTKNPTWTDPGSNPGLRSGRPATDHLSHGTALRGCYFTTKIPNEYNLQLYWSLPGPFTASRLQFTSSDTCSKASCGWRSVSRDADGYDQAHCSIKDRHTETRWNLSFIVCQFITWLMALVVDVSVGDYAGGVLKAFGNKTINHLWWILVTCGPR
jgi:hypothetical protein